MKAKISLYSSLLALVLAATLTVGCSKFAPRGDAQIATEVQQKLQADPAVPNKQIQVQTDKGVVTLSGTVSSDAERIAAGSDASQIPGVKTVLNNLTVGQQQAQLTPQQDNLQPAPAKTPAYDTAPRRVSSRSSNPAPRSYSSGGGGSYSAPQESGGGQSSAPPPQPQAQTPPPPPKPTTVTVQPGTTFAVRISEALNSNKNHAGDVFHGNLDSPIMVDDQTVIPSGAEVTGRVVETKAANRVVGQPFISLELTQISYNGHYYQIKTEPWKREGSSRGKRTAKTAGGGAAVGAIIGAIAGGGKGAAIGAATGAGAGGTAGAVTGQDDVKVDSETVLNFNLLSPVTVTPAANASRYRDRGPDQQ